MFRPFLNSLMLGSLLFPFIAIAGSTTQGEVIHFYGQIVEPTRDVSTQSSPAEMNCSQNGSVPSKTYSNKALMSGNVKNAQIASIKTQYLNKQKKLTVMNIEYSWASEQRTLLSRKMRFDQKACCTPKEQEGVRRRCESAYSCCVG